MEPRSPARRQTAHAAPPRRQKHPEPARVEHPRTHSLQEHRQATPAHNLGQHSTRPWQRPGRMSAAEDHEVISAIDNFRSEAVSTFGDPPVFHKSVPVKIRQHWAGDPALRYPLLAAVASCHSPISLLIPFLNRCFQPHPHQMQHVPIKSLHLQQVMRSPRG